jgi:hypothetical protein
MLFARKLLAPGPQPKHPGNVNPVLDTGPPAEPEVYQNEINHERPGILESLSAGGEKFSIVPLIEGGWKAPG